MGKKMIYRSCVDKNGNVVHVCFLEGTPLRFFYDGKEIRPEEVTDHELRLEIDEAIAIFEEGGNDYQDGCEWYMHNYRLEILRKAEIVENFSEPSVSRFSEVVTCDGKRSRYDYEYAEVQWVGEADEEIVADNAEWEEKFHEPLWRVEDGYAVFDTVGLSREHWGDREAREEYLAGWCMELDALAEYWQSAYRKQECATK